MSDDYLDQQEESLSEMGDQDEQGMGTESEASPTEASIPARVKDVLPGIIHLLPVAARPFFPGQAVPLLMSAKHWTKTIRAVVESDNKILGVVLVSGDRAEEATPEQFNLVGTACRREVCRRRATCCRHRPPEWGTDFSPSKPDRFCRAPQRPHTSSGRY